MGKLERKADRILEQFDIDDAPVPVEKIAKGLGVEVVFKPVEDSVSGMLYQDGDHRVIGVNANHPHVRQRFTIAHEIGHLVLHENRQMFVDKAVRIDMSDGKSSTATDQREIDANGFAADLLMPKHLVAKEVRRILKRKPKISGEDLAAALAEHFEVSTQAMQLRLTNLGICDPH